MEFLQVLNDPYYYGFFVQFSICLFLLYFRMEIMQKMYKNVANGHDRSGSGIGEKMQEQGEISLKSVKLDDISVRQKLLPSFDHSEKSLAALYLPVFCLVSLAEWLQGSYVYALYKSYGYDIRMIALLFVAGFMSSALSGTNKTTES